MIWVLSSILIGVMTCASVPKDEDCLCKIKASENITYCGFELRDPNCFPHGEYRCYNGNNGLAELDYQCRSTPCIFEKMDDSDTAGCMINTQFEKEVEKGSRPKCEGCWFVSEPGGKKLGVKSFYTTFKNRGTVLFTEVGDKWQEMPYRRLKTLSNTLPTPRDRVKPLKH